MVLDGGTQIISSSLVFVGNDWECGFVPGSSKDKYHNQT